MIRFSSFIPEAAKNPNRKLGKASVEELQNRLDIETDPRERAELNAFLADPRIGKARGNKTVMWHIRDLYDIHSHEREPHNRRAAAALKKDLADISESAYGAFSNYLGTGTMHFVQPHAKELNRRTDELLAALSRAHPLGRRGVDRGLGPAFAGGNLDAVEFRPRMGSVRRLTISFNPNGTVGIDADGRSLGNAVPLHGIGAAIGKTVGGGFR